MSDNPDDSSSPKLVDIRSLEPAPSVSYELSPGKLYLIQLRGDSDLSHDEIRAFERRLTAAGVQGLVIVGDFDVSIFELNAPKGAALIPRDIVRRDGDPNAG